MQFGLWPQCYGLNHVLVWYKHQYTTPRSRPGLSEINMHMMRRTYVVYWWYNTIIFCLYAETYNNQFPISPKCGCIQRVHNLINTHSTLLCVVRERITRVMHCDWHVKQRGILTTLCAYLLRYAEVVEWLCIIIIKGILCDFFIFTLEEIIVLNT